VSTPHDPIRECFILQQHVDAVHSTHTNESSAEGEPTSPDASASNRPPQGGDGREWQRARLDDLDEAQRALEEEQTRLQHELAVEAATAPTSEHAQELRCCINNDIHGPCCQTGFSESRCGGRTP
jgi:hypothetical protein